MTAKKSKSGKTTATAKKASMPANKKSVKAILETVKRKSTITKAKKKSVAIADAKPIKLNAEHEQRLAEWEAREADKTSFLTIWASKLSTTAKKVRDLNQQYYKILYKHLQDAYEVYDNVLRSEYRDDFFGALRGALYDKGFKVQSNTTESALIIRFVFGIETATKTVHDYSRALDGAIYDGVDVKEFANWLERKTLTKVIEEQRARKKEIETPTERLARARRVILRAIEIFETKPIVKFTRIEHTAERMIGNRFGLCVMLGYAYRTFGRGDDGLNVDINLNLLIPPSIDLEVTIIDKLARYIIWEVDEYEKTASEIEEEQWAEEIWERIVAGCDEEVEKNKIYWANRMQAALAEDQAEFLSKTKANKRKKN